MNFHQPQHQNFTQHARDPNYGAMGDACQLDEYEEHSTNRPHSGPQLNKKRSNNLDDAERKRKLADALSAEELPSSKRARLDPCDQKEPDSPRSIRQSMVSRLPAEAWHHIFTFVPPRTLGSLMLVNKQFNSYLDPLSGLKPTHDLGSSATHGLPKLGPDAIWQASRRLFWPRMPAALKGRSELEMWRLCCSRTCQFCKFRSHPDADYPGDQWKRGPGAKGVSPVFPFFIASCGWCLSAKSTTEIDLLLNSSIPSALLPGLPMVFLTRENHVVPPHLLASTSSSYAQPTKVFWNEQIENIKSAFEDAKKFGPAAAEEWTKGLGPQRKRCLADVARWERWHLAGGVDEMRNLSPNVYSQTAANNQESILVCLPGLGQLARTAKQPVGVKPAKAVINGGHRDDLSMNRDRALASVLADLPGQPSAQVESVVATSTEDITVSNLESKPTIEEEEILKAAKRAEIERRAYMLEPPIPPNVLKHMSVFQAAVQSRTALDDDSWQILRPYLLQQRKEAEIQEREIQANFQPSDVAVTAGDLRGVSGGVKVTDVDWDRAQGPLRGQISKYADEIIQNEWSGHTVTKKNAPKFAVDTLLYVRNKFYAKITSDIEAARAAGKSLITEPPEGPWTQKLTLENMKWIYDTKIKPYTDPVRKEVFLCNGCGRSTKFYEFSSVLQHYAAKHTNALSLGISVVHWRAEWPQKPIFKADSQHAAKPHTNTKTKHLKVHLPGIPGLPQPVAARPDLEYEHHTSNLGLSLSANYDADIQPTTTNRQETHQGEHSYERGYPLYQHPSQHERPPSRPGFYPETLYKLMGVAQNTDNGQSSGNKELRKSPKAAIKNSKYLDHIVMIAKQTWRKLANAKRLEDSVRVFAIIHHIAASFQKTYSMAVPLKLFIEALQTRKSIRQLGSVAGLSCKACKLNSHSTFQSKTYTLAKLSRHFDGTHKNHAAQSINLSLDWRVDMILLPEVSTLRKLRGVIGNDKEVLDVVSDTLPWVLETVGCGHEARRNGQQRRRAQDIEWQQPSALVRKAFRRSNEPSAAPRLELDGFEIIEQPAAWPRREMHDPIRDESHARQALHEIPPHTPSGHVEYRKNATYQQGYAKPAQTDFSMTGRYNSHWSNGYENDHSLARRSALYTPHSPYASRLVESYETVAIRNPDGGYLIRRPARPALQQELHYYKDHPHPHTLLNGSQHQHNHSNNGHARTMNSGPRISDYEEYDPRFPAATWRG